MTTREDKVLCVTVIASGNLQVTSKPDLYPLVNSYGDSAKASAGGNYLMVQYFRNYILRPVGKHKHFFLLCLVMMM
jgi:hypothetical protein